MTMAEKKQYSDADRIIVAFFEEEAHSLYGDDYSYIIKAARTYNREKTPGETQRKIETHARKLYHKLFTTTHVPDEEQLSKQIQASLQEKRQHPAISALRTLLNNHSVTIAEGRPTVKEKHIIDEAFDALELPQSTRAAFVRVIANIAKQSTKR